MVSNRKSGAGYLLDLPILDYGAALDLQRRMVAARVDGALDRDIVLMVEHPAVYTLGRRGGRENLRVSEGLLKAKGIPLVQIERGGDITYHGPGQLVVYPIVDLRTAKCRIIQFVENLEEVMIRTLADWGIEGGRNCKNRGVWVGAAKIGSLGIAVRRSVSFHGLALNINTDLEPFQWVNPCGLAGVPVTSMQQVLGAGIDMASARGAMRRHLQEIFGVELERISPETVHRLLCDEDRTAGGDRRQHTMAPAGGPR